MEKITYCATHDTYPLPNEPCWQCANPFIVEASQVNADLLEALKRLVLAFDVGDMKHTALNGRGYAALDESRKAIEKAKCLTES